MILEQSVTESEKDGGDTSIPRQLTLFAADSPARTYQWPAAARDWLEAEVDYGLSSIALLQSLGRDGLLSKTSPAYYPVTKDRILPLSFAGWSSAGMACPGGYLTLNISDWPNAAAVCSLSQVLETAVPQAYFLSPKAARGILRRAEKRGRVLPPSLAHSLQMLAGQVDLPDKQTS
jgi:hypothetical protein